MCWNPLRSQSKSSLIPSWHNPPGRLLTAKTLLKRLKNSTLDWFAALAHQWSESTFYTEHRCSLLGRSWEEGGEQLCRAGVMQESRHNDRVLLACPPACTATCTTCSYYSTMLHCAAVSCRIFCVTQRVASAAPGESRLTPTPPDACVAASAGACTYRLRTMGKGL